MAPGISPYVTNTLNPFTIICPNELIAHVRDEALELPMIKLFPDITTGFIPTYNGNDAIALAVVVEALVVVVVLVVVAVVVAVVNEVIVVVVVVVLVAV